MASELPTTSQRTADEPAQAIVRALRAPFMPSAVRDLAECGNYLDLVWPQLAPSLETAGFVGSALYMADMALDATEEVYDEPLLTRESLLAGTLSPSDLDEVERTLDVFQWVQPQLLLALAALAEGWDTPQVGGQGKAESRSTSEREAAHLAAPLELASPDAPPLPEIAELLGLAAPPDLYRAIAMWPGYVQAVWDELQHLSAYPLFRRRGRALYFYARSSSKFLAQPIEVSREALQNRGMTTADLDAAGAALDAALPELATMLMHCCAMRVALGITTREVVRPA